MSRETANRIIMNIADRDRSDMILYPLMIAVVIFSYLAILLFYVFGLLSKHGNEIPPWEKIFGVLALLLMGVSLILSVFYLLMIRNSNHSKRESTLRKAMIDHLVSEAEFGHDISGHIKKLRVIDAKFDSDERIGNPRIQIAWVAVPALAGFLLMWLPPLREYVIYLLAGSFVLSVLVALIVSPHVTTFAKEHDKRTMEFTAAFCNAYRYIGQKHVSTSKTVGYRSFPIFAVLTLITAGFFSAVWIYLVFKDMNRHFEEQWRFEDELLRAVRRNELERNNNGCAQLNIDQAG